MCELKVKHNMKYRVCSNIFITIVISSLVSPGASISLHVGRAGSIGDKPKWEDGLREATYEALIRERIDHLHLRDEIMHAPILDLQDTATPFGDIAVLARGQLYTSPQGYQFVQDPYQNDCDDCHNKASRCGKNQCAPYRPDGVRHLVALWTVKRVRHHDPQIGYRYEMHFVISPVNPRIPTEFVTRDGRFDYSIPGHIFIMKLKNYRPKHNIRIDKVPYRISGYEYTPNSVLNINAGEIYRDKHKGGKNYPEFLIGINGYKHGISHSSEEQVVKHHHIFIPDDDDEYDQKIHPAITTAKDVTEYGPNIKSTGEVSQKFVLTTRPRVVPTQNVPFTTGNGYVFTANAAKVSDFHRPSVYQRPGTTVAAPKLVRPTQPTPFVPSTYYVQYSQPDPIYNNNQPPTMTAFVTQTVHPSVFQTPSSGPSTTPTSYSSITTGSRAVFDDIFGSSTSPKAIVKDDVFGSSTSPKIKFPDSINAQLPPPDKGTDITVPYVASTQISRLATTPEQRTAQFITSTTQKTAPPTDIRTSSSKFRATSSKFSTADANNVKLTTQPRTTTFSKEETSTSFSTTPVPDPLLEQVFGQVPNTEKYYYKTTRIPTTLDIFGKTNTRTRTTTGYTNGLPKSTLLSTDSTRYDSTRIETTYRSEATTTEPTTRSEGTKQTTIYESTYTVPESTITATSATLTPTTYKPTDTAMKKYTRFRKPPKKLPNREDIDIFSEKRRNNAKSTTRNVHFDEDIFNTEKQLKTTQIKSSTKYEVQPTISTNATSTTARNQRLSKYLKYRRNKPFRNNRPETRIKKSNDDEIETKTSQSLITSISFTVNKNDHLTERPVRANVRRLTTKKDSNDFDVFVAQVPTKEENTTDATSNTKAFEDIAQSLINHARIVTYTNAATIRPTKRSYIAQRKTRK